jgi:hypothetical protein
MERQGERTIEYEAGKLLGPTAKYACLGVALFLLVAVAALALLGRV